MYEFFIFPYKGGVPMAKFSERQLDRARDLRGRMTDAERKLWYEFLRYNPAKFYKQRPLGPFILDFYCHALSLAIEVDGGQHYTDRGMAHDRARTAFLENHGIRVLRFSDTDVLTRFDDVCRAILLEIEKTSISPASPPRGGGPAGPER